MKILLIGAGVLFLISLFMPMDCRFVTTYPNLFEKECPDHRPYCVEDFSGDHPPKICPQGERRPPDGN